MKRAFVLAVLIALGSLSITTTAQRGGAKEPMVVEVDKIKDNLFVLRGGGGNTAAFVTANGVVLVDTKNLVGGSRSSRRSRRSRTSRSRW